MVDAAFDKGVMRITVCHSPLPRVVHETVLELPAGCTVGQALDALRAQGGWASALDMSALSLAIWGMRVRRDQVLQCDDRLELMRPLRVDPKLARRERFHKQGARSAGLFAKRRPGAKPGY